MSDEFVKDIFSSLFFSKFSQNNLKYIKFDLGYNLYCIMVEINTREGESC